LVKALLAVHVGLFSSLAPAESSAATLRVASVTAAPDQPQATNKAVIFYEDFDQLPDWRTRYFEYVRKGELCLDTRWRAGEWRDTLPV
jgi:hypothetical protein